MVITTATVTGGGHGSMMIHVAYFNCRAIATSRVTWDRCYDFLNIFPEKFDEQIGVKTKLNYAKIGS
jgi:hypothetical protein